jgi:RNA polymerase sigma-70 factor (ECF subfamily)
MVAAQAGDRAAYETLLRDCIPFIHRVARGQGVPSDFVDDVVQETLLTIHQARRTYDPSRSFTAWLRTIAQRRAIDGLRRGGRARKREIHKPLAYESHADPGGDPEQAAFQIGRQTQRPALPTGSATVEQLAGHLTQGRGKGCVSWAGGMADPGARAGYEVGVPLAPPNFAA